MSPSFHLLNPIKSFFLSGCLALGHLIIGLYQVVLDVLRLIGQSHIDVFYGSLEELKVTS